MGKKSILKRAEKKQRQLDERRKRKEMTCPHCKRQNPKIKKIRGQWVYVCRSCHRNFEEKVDEEIAEIRDEKHELNKQSKRERKKWLGFI